MCVMFLFISLLNMIRANYLSFRDMLFELEHEGKTELLGW